MIDYSYIELEEDVFEASYSNSSSVDTRENNYFYEKMTNNLICFSTTCRLLYMRLKAEFMDYSKRWDNGEFKDDVLPDDIPIIQNDIDYIRERINA